jgi:hypothetical protein
MTIVKKSTTWAMVGILLIAAALRLWALPELPVGLHYDEAANVILTRQIAQEGVRPLFIRAYTGKEVLFFYGAAPWVWMTGGAPWGLRLGAAMMGVLTVAATYAAVRAMWQTPGMALAAAGWVAVAYPHVLLSRYGFRAVSQPLMQALTLALLWRGLRSGRLRWLIGGGAALGLTGYTYLAARLFPIPLGIALAWGWVRQPPARRPRMSRRLAVALAAALVAFAPLGIFFLKHPETFTTRIDQVAAPTWAAAWQGIRRCVMALGLPGQGDPYVRFNQPGLPVMDGLSVILSGIGGWALLRRREHPPLRRAAVLLVLVSTLVMLLPSALATAEITPSNLRMVGLFPLIAVLPAAGLVFIGHGVRRLFGTHGIGEIPWRWVILGLAAVGALRTGAIYARWARSTALFYAADGEMVLAARTLDVIYRELEGEEATITIASEHYRHPTVAALAEHYPRAKWITGGATRVLPAQGVGITMVPRSLAPPAPWPPSLTEAWTVETRADPAGKPGLYVYRLDAEARDILHPVDRVTDFAHVVHVHEVTPCEHGQVGDPCAVRIIWEPRASYPALQPVIRLLHPETGEWDRTMPFHYPAEMWTPGEIVIDQLTVTPPVGMPPGRDYQIALGFYDPEQQRALPRLDGEQFAGLEMRVPSGSFAPPAPERWTGACPGVPTRPTTMTDALALDGWQLAVPDAVPQGGIVALTLCWRAERAGPSARVMRLDVRGPVTETLYVGAPAGGYDFRRWREGERVEDRYRLSLPKTLPAGTYTLGLAIDDHRAVALGSVDVTAVARRFSAPSPDHPLDVGFGDELQLLGYDRDPLHLGEPWTVTLYWQVRRALDRDYRVFVHLQDLQTGAVVAQSDGTPGTGSYPTSLWMEGEVVTDPHTLTLPPDLQMASYAVNVGLYVPMTGSYLAVEGERSLRLIEKIQAEP